MLILYNDSRQQNSKNREQADRYNPGLYRQNSVTNLFGVLIYSIQGAFLLVGRRTVHPIPKIAILVL